MSEQQKPFEEEMNSQVAEEPEEQTPDQENMGDEPEEIDLAQVLTGLKSENEREKAVSAEYLRRLQQLQAEYDNFRKRTQREKEDLAKYATEKLIKELLPVLDNFERGLAAGRSTQDVESLLKGIEMVQRQLNGVLEKEGLALIAAVGEEFDPNKHEAIMHVESEEYATNTVVDELQKGYYLKDKVIRPSMVRVCK